MSASAALTVKVGTKPQVTATFRDADGVLDDPTTVQVIVKPPTGAQATYNHPDATILNSGVGIWKFTFPTELTVAGDYWVYVNGGGNVEAADEVKITVRGVHVTRP